MPVAERVPDALAPEREPARAKTQAWRTQIILRPSAMVLEEVESRCRGSRQRSTVVSRDMGRFYAMLSASRQGLVRDWGERQLSAVVAALVAAQPERTMSTQPAPFWLAALIESGATRVSHREAERLGLGGIDGAAVVGSVAEIRAWPPGDARAMALLDAAERATEDWTLDGLGFIA